MSCPVKDDVASEYRKVGQYVEMSWMHLSNYNT